MLAVARRKPKTQQRSTTASAIHTQTTHKRPHSQETPNEKACKVLNKQTNPLTKEQ